MIKSCGNKQDIELDMSWHLTNWCNYDCNYCSTLLSLTKNFTDDQHSKNYKLVLSRLKTIEVPWTMCLVGGEPSLNPYIEEIVEEMGKIPNLTVATLFTNFSRPASFYKTLMDLGNGKLFTLATYHPGFTKGQFVEKCIELRKEEFEVFVNFTPDPSTWDELDEMVKILNDNGVITRPNILHSTPWWKANYTKEFYDRFLHYFDSFEDIWETTCNFEDGTSKIVRDYQFEINEWNRFKGYKCTPLSYMIDVEGDIKNVCTRRKVPISLKNENMVKQEICPNTICQGRKLITYYKEKNETV